jgi:hypothetical protein
MKFYQPVPQDIAEAASFLTAHEQQDLWQHAILMADSRGVMMRLTGMFGRRVEAIRRRFSKTADRIGGQTWADFTKRAQDAVEDTLWSSYNLATFGLEATPRLLRPKRSNGNHLHKFATAASGVASGFIGLPGVLFDIPFTTTTILRSIAEVARDAGEDVSSEETKRVCLEILAFGGPSPADDETEIGYWATRIGINHIAVNLLIKSAGDRFGLIISDKLLTQAVPVVGAVAGGVLNYAFTDYYQTMARIQFCLRSLDRRTGQPAAVRASFASMVDAARNRRRIMRRTGDKAAAAYLPREDTNA